jgi:hypothetical protein
VGSNVHEQLKLSIQIAYKKVLRKGPQVFPTQKCVELLVVQQRLKEKKGACHTVALPFTLKPIFLR